MIFNDMERNVELNIISQEFTEPEIYKNHISKNNVYIIGASFSASMAELPTTKNFLSKMFQANLPDNEILIEVMKICDSRYYITKGQEEILKLRDELNIEYMFNMIESLDDRRRTVLDTDDLGYLDDEYDENYLSRLQCITARFLWDQSVENSPNEKLLNFVKQLDEKDAIITFNWDLLIERALEYAGKEWSYLPTKGKIFICKLHGSINWLKRHLKSAFVPNEKINERNICEKLNLLIVDRLVGGTFFNHYDLPRGKDPRIGLGYVPDILAFSFNKDISRQPFQKLWSWAYKCIIGSYRLTFLGYSLPQQDLASQHLFNSALHFHSVHSGIGKESSKCRIIVDTDSNSIARIEAPCLHGSTAVKKDIADFIAQGMEVDVPKGWEAEQKRV